MTIESYHYLLILIRNEDFKNRKSNKNLLQVLLRERQRERERERKSPSQDNPEK